MSNEIDEELKLPQGKTREEELLESKLMWRNRVKKPMRKLSAHKDLKDVNNELIIDPKAFDQLPLNYLRMDFVEGTWNEKKVAAVYYKVIDAVIDPMHDPIDRKRLLYDCRRLLRSFTNPVFTGAVDPLVNRIDILYADEALDRRTKKGITLDQEFTPAEIELLSQYDEIRNRINDKKIFKGFWKILDSITGSTPPTMEGATLCYSNNALYLFGGFSRDVYDEMRICDLNKKKWSIVPPGTVFETPPKRYGHTMDVYKDYLVIFGGAGPFNKNAKMRRCYKDLHLFDTKQLKWVSNLVDSSHSSNRPEQRTYHASAIFGNILLLHGGTNTEDKSVYDDMFLYDLDIHKWVSLKRQKSFQESNIGNRCMHSMTTVVSSE